MGKKIIQNIYELGIWGGFLLIPWTFKKRKKKKKKKCLSLAESWSLTGMVKNFRIWTNAEEKVVTKLTESNFSQPSRRLPFLPVSLDNQFSLAHKPSACL